jgi:hypothetical protein
MGGWNRYLVIWRIYRTHTLHMMTSSAVQTAGHAHQPLSFDDPMLIQEY